MYSIFDISAQLVHAVFTVRGARGCKATVVLVVLPALASCSAPPEGAHVSDRLQRSVVALAQTPADIAQAEFLATRACLREAGFEIPFGSPSPTSSTSSIVGVPGLFASESAARISGYGTTIRETDDPITAFGNHLGVADRARFETALNGASDARQASVPLMRGGTVSRSTEGCAAEGTAAVYGSVATALRLENFANEVYAQVEPSSIGRVVKRDLPDYRTCMAKSGYQLGLQDTNASKLARERFGVYRNEGDRPKPAEAAMAGADATCQHESGMVTDTNDLFFRSAANWVVAHEGQILAWQDDLSGAQRRAKNIIDNG